MLLDLSALASEVARLTAKLSEKEKQLYQSRTTCKETEKAYRESIAYMLGKALTDGFTSLSGFTRLPHRLFTVGKAAAVQWWLRRKAK